MKKRICSVLMVCVMLLSILPFSGCSESSDRVTRGEWIMMLTEVFGMTSYADGTARYSDVAADSDLFARVQSAVGWQVLSVFSADTLEPDKKITREEAASCAAIAAGCPVSDDQFNEKGVFNTDAAIKFALANGLLENERRLSRALTYEEAEAMLEAARNAYLHAPFEEKMNIEPAENVILPEELALDEDNVDDDRVVLSGTAAALQVGDIFFTPPTEEYPAGEPRRVVEIEEEDGQMVARTEVPPMEEVYQQIDLHTTVRVSPENIIWAAGVQAAGASGLSAEGGDTYIVNLIGQASEEPLVIPLDDHTISQGGLSRSFTFGDGSFHIERSNHNSSVIGSGEGARALENSSFVYNDTPSIEDFNGKQDSWTKNLEIDSSLSGKYKITGTISLNDIVITVKDEWGLFGLKSASIQVDSSITSSLKYEGSLSGDLKIATIPIPIYPGISVTAELYLYMNASGELSVRADLGGSAKVEYANGQVRATSQSSAGITEDGNIKVNFGANLTAALNVLTPLIDAGIKIGGEMDASAHVAGSCKVTRDGDTERLLYQESLSIAADLYYPIVSIQACSSHTLVGKLGLSNTWNIITRANATHVQLANYEWVFWEEEVLKDADGTITEGEETTAGDTDGVGASDGKKLDLTKYVITLRGEPQQLQVEFPQGEEQELVWTSDNPNVATVSATGVVSPVSTGQTQIMVSLRSDPSVNVKCAVYVEEIGEENWEFLSTGVFAKTGAVAA